MRLPRYGLPHLQEGIRLAAKNFLNKKPEDITMDLQDSLQGNMREIIGTLSKGDQHRQGFLL